VVLNSQLLHMQGYTGLSDSAEAALKVDPYFQYFIIIILTIFIIHEKGDQPDLEHAR
jgi:hypothetical protein